MVVRERVPRAWICWMFMSLVSPWDGQSAGAQSCHEVRTAFQLRHIGPLKWVPETAATDPELQICKHQGPSCCTRKMEESYYAAARRDTLQNIFSYNLELKYLILGHAASFQDTFHSLLSFAHNHTLTLLDFAYKPVAHRSRALVHTLFSDLELYLQDDTNISIVQTVRHFHDELFPLVYQHLLNPGLASASWSAEATECLRATQQDLNPFGPHPQKLAQQLSLVLGVGRSLMQALSVGIEILNATESASMTKDCMKALVRMQYCPHCRGLTLIRPCQGLCLNVMRGCLAGLAELQGEWSRYITLLEATSGTLALGYKMELTLLGIRERINDAILNAQFQGPRLSTLVEKVCGPLTKSPSSSSASPTEVSPTGPVSVTGQDLWPDMVSSSMSPTEAHHSEQQQHTGVKKSLYRSLPLKPSKHDQPRSLKKISKEFMNYIQRYESFFSSLPEMLCEGEVVVDEGTCWNGEEQVESYSGSVVGNGLQAQSHNPEIKVRGLELVLITAKRRLERFNQELGAETWLGELKETGDGSGRGAEASGECDDEDGCQSSGEDEDRGKKGLPPVVPPSVSVAPRSEWTGEAAASGPHSPSLFLTLTLFSLLLST